MKNETSCLSAKMVADYWKNVWSDRCKDHQNGGHAKLNAIYSTMEPNYETASKCLSKNSEFKLKLMFSMFFLDYFYVQLITT